MLSDVLHGAGHHDLSAMNTGTRAYVDDVVGAADGILVVFHDQHGVAEIAQMDQRFQ